MDDQCNPPRYACLGAIQRIKRRGCKTLRVHVRTYQHWYYGASISPLLYDTCLQLLIIRFTDTFYISIVLPWSFAVIQAILVRSQAMYIIHSPTIQFLDAYLGPIIVSIALFTAILANFIIRGEFPIFNSYILSFSSHPLSQNYFLSTHVRRCRPWFTHACPSYSFAPVTWRNLRWSIAYSIT
jgi:hypothetical protein